MGDAAAAASAHLVLASESAPPSRDRDRVASSDPSTASLSKRKWSPCTWRYAIEETQSELGSKPRSNYIFSPPSGHRERERERDRERASEPPRRPASPDKAEGPQSGCDQIPAGQSPNMQSVEKSANHKKQGQKDGDEMEDGVKKSAIQKKSGQKDGEFLEDRMKRKKKKEAMRRRAEKEGQSEDAGKRRKREMTPSELYFCEVCAAKANKGGGSTGDDCC